MCIYIFCVYIYIPKGSFVMFFYHTNIFLVDVLKSCRFPKKATNPKKLSIWWYEFELVGTLHHVTWV